VHLLRRCLYDGCGRKDKNQYRLSVHMLPRVTQVRIRPDATL